MGQNVTGNRHIYNITVQKKPKYYSKASDNNIKNITGMYIPFTYILRHLITRTGMMKRHTKHTRVIT